MLQIDLEWDPARSITTWDITFSSGTEYEVDAASGKLLGSKPKAAAKIATLTPLNPGNSSKKLLTFQEIIQRVEKSKGQRVVEMELKQLKGRATAIYEVVLTDGTTHMFDASTGDAIDG